MSEYMNLPNGATLHISQMGELDYIVYQHKGNSCHIYTGEDLDSGADMEVCVYDNIQLNIFGSRKRYPTIVIEGGEFPCTLVIKKTDNMTVREEQS